MRFFVVKNSRQESAQMPKSVDFTEFFSSNILDKVHYKILDIII